MAKLRVLLNGTLSSHAWAISLDTHFKAVASVHGSLEWFQVEKKKGDVQERNLHCVTAAHGHRCD
jgi:hypothetical protein